VISVLTLGISRSLDVGVRLHSVPHSHVFSVQKVLSKSSS
jgi:hypothetical protein